MLPIVAIPTEIAEAVRATLRAPVYDSPLTQRWPPTLPRAVTACAHSRGSPRTVEAYAHGRRLLAQEYVGGWGIRAGHRKTARPSQRRLSTGQQHHRWLFHLPH